LLKNDCALIVVDQATAKVNVAVEGATSARANITLAFVINSRKTIIEKTTTQCYMDIPHPLKRSLYRLLCPLKLRVRHFGRISTRALGEISSRRKQWNNYKDYHPSAMTVEIS
jgi:hypothetical protein